MSTFRIKFGVCLLAMTIPASAFASQNIGQCGWGSKLMEGNEGIAPQVLAVTTNGTSGNQTFGITSGTSGCTQDGVVRSSWKTAMFVDGNMNKLARDMAVGEGESLDSLANLLGMDAAAKGEFAQVAKSRFSEIFVSDEVTSQEVVASLKRVLTSEGSLAQYGELL